MYITKEIFNSGDKLWRINNIPQTEPFCQTDWSQAENCKSIPCEKLSGKILDKEEFGNSIYFGCQNPYSLSGKIDPKSSVFDYLNEGGYGYLIEIEFIHPCQYIFYDACPPILATSEWEIFVKEIEKHVSETYTSPFMNWLGRSRLAFKCLDLADSPDSVESKRYEIIIPHMMLFPPIFHQRNLGFWKKEDITRVVREVEEK